MGYSLTIHHDKKYIHYTHDGVIERKEIGEVWSQLLKTAEFTEKKYNLLSDYRGATFNFSASDLDVIENFLESLKNILTGKKNAVIVEAPHETVISILFENKMSRKINFHVKTFSTEEAAIYYLL